MQKEGYRFTKSLFIAGCNNFIMLQKRINEATLISISPEMRVMRERIHRKFDDKKKKIQERD